MTYSIDITSTLMQNHVAGRPLPKQETLSVSTAGDGSPIMFALDTAQTLTVTMRDPSSATGWAKVDLGAQLAGMNGLGAGPLVQNFATMQDAGGSTWMVLAVSDQALGASVIYLSSALPETMTADDWRSFSKLVSAREVPATMWFTQVLIGSGADPDGPPAAMGVGVSGGHAQQYYFNPAAANRSWDYVPIAVPVGTSGILAAAAGKVPGLGPGLYGLYIVSGKTMNLTFTTVPVVIGSMPPQSKIRPLALPAPYSPTSTAALAALPVTTDGLTELYLSGAGLQRYTVSAQKDDNSQPLPLFDKTLFVATQELTVSCDPQATTIDVWAINYYEQLVHTVGTVETADLARPHGPGDHGLGHRGPGDHSPGHHGPGSGDDPVYDWQPALTLGQEVTAIAAYRAPLPAAPRAGAGAITQAAVAYAVKPDILTVMLKDDDAELWQTQAVTFEAPDTGVDLYTYTTQIVVTDEDGCGVSGLPVQIRPTTDVPALVNGKYYALLATVPKEAVTDPGGGITIVLETTDLVAPFYEITLTSDDGTVLSETEDPSKDVTQYLGTVTSGSQIYDAQCSDGSGKLFPAPTQAQKDACDAAATGIDTMMDLYNQMSGTGLHAGRPRPHPHTVGHDRHGRPFAGPRVPDGPESFLVRHHPHGRVEVLHGAAARKAAGPQDLWTLVKSAGDLLWAAINGAGQVLQYGLQLVDDVYHFVIDIGGQMLAFVVQIAGQALSAIGFIVKQLGLWIKDLVNWLGFLFDWSDVLDTHKVLRHVYELGFGYIVSETAVLKGYVDQAFQQAIGQLDPDGLLPIHTDLPAYSQKARTEPGVPAPAYDSPQTNWARQKLIDNSAGSKIDQVTPSFPGDSLENLNPDWVTTAQGFADALQPQIGADYATLDWSGMADLFVRLTGATVLAAGQGLADAVFDAVADAVTSFRDLSETRLEIPVLTWIYEDVICEGDGSKLTLLDAATLLTAVPATVAAKAVTGANLFSDELAQAILQAATWEQMIDAIVAMPPSAIPALPGVPALPGAEDIPALYGAAIFLMASASCRGISATLDLVALYQGVDVVGAPLKLAADWCTLFYSVANAALVTRVRWDDTDRERIDWAFVGMPLLSCISASYLLGYFSWYASQSPATKALAVAESVMGGAMIVMVIVSYNLEMAEGKPDEVDTVENWHKLLGFKLGQNLSASVNTALAFEAVVPDGNPYKQILKFSKFFTAAAETGFGIYLAKTALDEGTSDIA